MYAVVANPAHSRLNRQGNYFFPCPFFALHNYLVSRDRFGCPVPPRQSCSLLSPHTLSTVSRLNLWCLLTGFLPLSTTASIYTVNRHPEFIGLRNYRVPMAYCHYLTNRFQMEAPVAPSRSLQEASVGMAEAFAKPSRSLLGGFSKPSAPATSS